MSAHPQSHAASEFLLDHPLHDSFCELLARADIVPNGSRPWDIQIHNPHAIERILSEGSLGLGESHVDGWWDCEQLDEMVCRALRARLDKSVAHPGLLISILKAKVINLQSVRRAWQVGRQHYDLGNDLFEAMLDPYMAYSCGYWRKAETLEQAQQDKLDLVCQKLQLKPGMTLLDIGCGWGSLMRFAAEHYGVQCTGLTVSKEQAHWGMNHCGNLPVKFEFTDYRLFNPEGRQRFDRIASIGMFEHVGHKNYSTYFQMAKRSLKADGLMLLHTIGKNDPGRAIDPWIERYIFPNGALPSASELIQASEPWFILEDWHNFGADYDKTLMAWQDRFEKAWPRLQQHYDERFYRMWRYYLLVCAGTFRARDNQLWQLVLSPNGHTGGYRRPKI